MKAVRTMQARSQKEPKWSADDQALIASLEMAFRMQTEAREVFDLSREPLAIRELYGSSPSADACLTARRPAERGVRMVQVFSSSDQGWDDHKDILARRNRRTTCSSSTRRFMPKNRPASPSASPRPAPRAPISTRGPMARASRSSPPGPASCLAGPGPSVALWLYPSRVLTAVCGPGIAVPVDEGQQPQHHPSSRCMVTSTYEWSSPCTSSASLTARSSAGPSASGTRWPSS
ncbi:MAG: DUF1501 domain-containing protein [Planctomycetia bacterium]|nr:DUF1501 domain-containing protein [Planctomycetia bacterium]